MAVTSARNYFLRRRDDKYVFCARRAFVVRGKEVDVLSSAYLIVSGKLFRVVNVYLPSPTKLKRVGPVKSHDKQLEGKEVRSFGGERVDSIHPGFLVLERLQAISQHKDW